MLKTFYADNYKSLINVTFSPREISLLLGLNNVGKTNLCQAMRFLAGTAAHPLDLCADTIAGGRIGITNRYFDKNTVDFRVLADVPFNEEVLQFDYKLTIRVAPAVNAPPTLAVEQESLRVTGFGFNDVCLLENTGNGVNLLHEIDHLRGTPNVVHTTAPRDATMLFRLYDLATNARANCFKRYLMSWCYYALSPEAIRGSLHLPRQVVLTPDGSNLASVVYQMKTSDERQYRMLISHLKRLDPAIDIINFQVASEANVFMFFEDTLGFSLPASNASSGTLRYLGLLYTLLVQSSFFPGSVFLVEEPENGIYVGFLKNLLEAAASAKGKPQVIFTTHSPYFIDLFEDRLDSLYVVKRGEKHSTIMQPEVATIRARLNEFPLGEQHFREMLG